jgi:hypothetical protein
MKITNFIYTKKKDDKTDKYQVLVLHETDEYIEGINLTELEPEVILEIFEIQKEYEKKINSFVKNNYRKFLKSNIKSFMDSNVNSNKK